MSYPYLIQGSNIVIVIGNNPHTISTTHLAYEKIKEAIKAGDWDSVKNFIEPVKVILNYGQGNVSVQGDVLYWKGSELKGGLSKKIIEMLQEGFPIAPLVNFMDNLMLNPSKRAVDELYTFLEKGNLPITEDGCFLAYKKVNATYTDIHSGSVLNAPAVALTQEQVATMPQYAQGKEENVTVELINGVTTVSMPRNTVDDNAANTCSAGLHFCSKEYLTAFGGSRTVILKINPRDVVSIPADYNATKGRTCSYQVIGEVGVNVDPATVFTTTVQDNVAPYTTENFSNGY